MKRNEKILLGGLLAVLAVWQGWPLLHAVVFQPLDSRRAQIVKLDKSIRENRVREKELDAAQARLKDWAARSLPPDPIIASSLYQNWLLEFATKKRFSQLTVTPGRVDARAKNDVLFQISATIKAQARMEQLCDFLYEFRQAPLLHRIISLTIEAPQPPVPGGLNMTILVESLALKTSPARTTLFADPAAASTLLVLAEPRSAYDEIVRKNLFSRSFGGDQNAVNEAEFVEFRASFRQDDQQVAWLYDRRTMARSALVAGKPFRIAGLEGTVLAVNKDHILLKIRDDEYRLNFGQNLTQRRRTSKPKNDDPFAPSVFDSFGE